MDTEHNRDKNKDNGQKQEWNDPAFAWDEMKDGIFGKILEEDPGFFEEKPRRRMAIWIWFGAAILLLGSLGVWQLAGGEPDSVSSPAFFTPTQDKMLSNEPVAGTPPSSGREDIPVGNEQSTVIDAEPENTPDPVILNGNAEMTSEPVAEIPPSSDREDLPNDKKQPPATEVKPERTPNPGILNGNAEMTSEPVVTGNMQQSVADMEHPVTEPVKNPEAEPSYAVSQAFPSRLPGRWQLLEAELSAAKPLSGQAAAHKKTSPAPDKWEITAMGGAVLSFSRYTGNSAAVNLRNDHTSPFFGFHFGIDLSRSLSEKSHLFAGLNRQVIYQNIDIETTRQVEVLEEDALLHETHYVVGNRTEQIFGDTVVTSLERNRLVNYNEMRTIQAHAGYARDLNHGRWTFSPFAGIAAGLVDYQDGMTVAADKSIFSFDNDNPVFRRLQLKMLAGLGLEHALSGKTSFVIQYRFDKQWNNGSEEGGVSLRPANHYFSAGITWRW